MKPYLNPTVRWYNQLAFHLNYIVANTTDDLSIDEVRDAARNRSLLSLLDKRFPFADFYYFVHRPEILQDLEAGLSDAASWLSWQEGRRLGPSKSGLALAMAIVLEAIQNANCNPQSNPPLLATPWEKEATLSFGSRLSALGCRLLTIPGLSAIGDPLLAIRSAIRRLIRPLSLVRRLGNLPSAIGHKFPRSPRQFFQSISTYFKGFQRISNQNLAL
jgi:hypothetical protein